MLLLFKEEKSDDLKNVVNVHVACVTLRMLLRVLKVREGWTIVGSCGVVVMRVFLYVLIITKKDKNKNSKLITFSCFTFFS